VSEPAAQASSAISKTSIYVAAGRAVGAREPDQSARNPDYLAEALLGDPSKLEVTTRRCARSVAATTTR
jgi:hypothetical protein